jgi:hypothetical protein
MWHARPGSDMEGIRAEATGPTLRRRLLDSAGADVLIVGHTHDAFSLVAGKGKIVNPGACCSKIQAFEQSGSLAVPDGYRPATFGVLELPSKRFRVFQAADGIQVHGLAGSGSMRARLVRVGNYRKRLADRGIPGGKHGAVAVIQRANSDLRCNPHVHAIFLDGLYAPDRDGKGFMFHPAPAPKVGMMPSMYEVGTDLLRVASFALVAHGYEEMGENLLRTGLELIEGAAGEVENRPPMWESTRP